MRGARRWGRMPYGNASFGNVQRYGEGKLHGLPCMRCNPVVKERFCEICAFEVLIWTNFDFLSLGVLTRNIFGCRHGIINPCNCYPRPPSVFII